MLHLASDTRASWIDDALGALPVVLLDHAHCEKKAASTAMNLIFRYADQRDLVGALSALAREELQHFELMLGVLDARKLSLQRLEPAPYAGLLHQAVRRGEPQRLLDTLVCCALIEARSCERMKLLGDGLAASGQDQLAQLYRSLLASEAQHFTIYTDLAATRFGREATLARLTELAQHEADCLTRPAPAVRLHS